MSLSSYYWTPEQIKVIEESYKPGGGGLSAAAKGIPDRPKAAIATKACRLKVTHPKPRKNSTDSSA